MILIGQYDSSYVRRVGIALTLYGVPFEHRPWSTFGEADKIRPYNPLVKVPTLVLDDGDVLIDSHVILDYVDSLTSGGALYPRGEPERHRAMKVAALGTGLADLAVSLFYEMRLHERVSDLLVKRRRSQIADALSALEAARAAGTGPYWFGDAIGHADIAVVCALRHACDSHPDLIDLAAYPALCAHAARLEAMPVFTAISQPFIAPA